jgi:hypothetical protein
MFDEAATVLVFECLLHEGALAVQQRSSWAGAFPHLRRPRKSPTLDAEGCDELRLAA